MKKRIFIAVLVFFPMVFGYTTFAKSGAVPRMPKEELKALLGNPDLVIIDVRLDKDWTGIKRPYSAPCDCDGA